MSEYKPGTVAEVTYKGKRIRAARCASGWQMLEAVNGNLTWTSGSSVTDVRPLVVLDPKDRPLDCWPGEGSLRRYADALDQQHPAACDLLRAIADQIEAQTKPPRIPEPGLWGVVCDSDGTRYIHDSLNPEDYQWSVIGNRGGGPRRRRWDDLIDPVEIREGLS